MASINKGKVEVRNGQTLVRHVWELLLVTVSADFAEGDAVTWPGGGNGTVSDYDANDKRLYMYRTSGPEPDIGDTITGPLAQTGVVNSMGNGSPPNFDQESSLNAANRRVFTVPYTATSYSVAGSVQSDSFTLSGAYLEADDDFAPYGIHVGFTSAWGLGLIEVGDVDAPAIVSDAMLEIERRGVFRGALRKLAADQTGILAGVLTRINFDTVVEDTDSYASASGKYVVPTGHRRARLRGNIVTSADPTTLQILIQRNDVWEPGLPDVIFTDRNGGIASYPLQVADGDELSLLVKLGVGVDVVAAGSWFSIETEELE